MLDTSLRYNIAGNIEDADSYGCDELREAERNSVVRKFINSAVYVEAPVKNSMPGYKNSFAYSHNNSSDEDASIKTIRVKKCVCTTDKENCACHPQNINGRRGSSTKLFPPTSKSCISVVSIDSDTITVKPKNDLKLSLVSLTSVGTTTGLNREEAYRIWLEKKEKERVLKQLQKEKEEILRKIEKEKQMQIERENFRNWLINKKKEDERRKQEKEQRAMEEQLQREIEKQKHLENQMRFRDWVKQKQQADLEKKIKEKMENLKTEEEKQRRLRESAKSYEIWLANSKFKPKPLPLNRGLDSLRSSMSLTYINPTPWVSNVQDNLKPCSQ